MNNYYKNELQSKSMVSGESKRVNTFVTIIFVSLLLLLFSKTTLLAVAQFIPGRFSNGIAIVGSAVLFIGLMSISKYSTKYIFDILIVLIITIICFMLVYYGNTISLLASSNPAQDALMSIFLIPYLGILLVLKFRVSTKNICLVILIFGLLEGIIGIIQHFMGTSIFDTSVFNTVYFNNGSSSNNLSNLGGFGSVRAFGTMDSGLSLGIFVLFCMSILLIDAKLNFNVVNRARLILIFIFLIVIYSTITRNVYIGLFCLAVFYFYRAFLFSHKQLLSLLYVVLLIFSAVILWMNKILTFFINISQSVNIPTFSVRYQYLDIAINSIPNFWRFLFGSKITSTSDFPIDNSFIAYLMNYGFIYTIMLNVLMYVVFKWALNHCSKENAILVIFMLLYPIMSIANNVTYSFVIIYILITLIIGSSNKKNYAS